MYITQFPKPPRAKSLPGLGDLDLTSLGLGGTLAILGGAWALWHYVIGPRRYKQSMIDRVLGR